MQSISQHRLMQSIRFVLLLVLSPALWVHYVVAADPALLPFERTETREPCSQYTPQKRPMFGDLHVHTSYSFDSYLSSQRNDPNAAYRYAKGETILVPNADGISDVPAKISRPLDFAGITDHAEFLGEINLCSGDSSSLAYWWPHCAMMRSDNIWIQLLAANWMTRLGGQEIADPERSFVCKIGDCDVAHANAWQSIQEAAEDHYDRTSDCTFTSFIGYEYTDAKSQKNMHRNVIFRNERVTDRAISIYDTGTGNFPKLWSMLRSECIEGDEGCDVLIIPHNPNLSAGLMFRDPVTPKEAEERLFFEPVVELIQHKGASECRFDKLLGRGLNTEDELCDFEQIDADNLNMLGSVHGERRTERANIVPLDEFANRNMVRNVLKDGLAIGKEDGINPFRMGFIGSTDTHSATPGAAEEDNYVGHLGKRDSEYRNVQDHFFANPGGLAVVWSEENSRDAIFKGIRHRETYATSGTRPTVRLFAGENLDENLCSSPDGIARAYKQGVPMGSEIRGGRTVSRMRLLVSAQKDVGIEGRPGTDLQRIQIIKGWVDNEGSIHESIVDAVGDANNGATVDPNTCMPVGVGSAQLCKVWEDPSFDPTQDAFYYLRVLENPSCRWSTLQCQSAGVNPFSPSCKEQALVADKLAKKNGATGSVYRNCCIDEKTMPFYSPVIQERAWTSPVWYHSEP